MAVTMRHLTNTAMAEGQANFGCQQLFLKYTARVLTLDPSLL